MPNSRAECRSRIGLRFNQCSLAIQRVAVVNRAAQVEVETGVAIRILGVQYGPPTELRVREQRIAQVDGSVAVDIPIEQQARLPYGVIDVVGIRPDRRIGPIDHIGELPENKLVSFSGLASSSYYNTLFIGEPITVKKFFHFLGVNPATGIFLFTDSHGTPTSSPSNIMDNTVHINSAPKFYGGVVNNFRYKGIELDVLVQFVKQKLIWRWFM